MGLNPQTIIKLVLKDKENRDEPAKYYTAGGPKKGVWCAAVKPAATIAKKALKKHTGASFSTPMLSISVWPPANFQDIVMVSPRS